MKRKNHAVLTLLVLYVALIGILGISTVTAHLYGVETTMHNVYYSAWFCGYWIMLALLSTVVLIRRRTWRQLPTFLLHASLLMILIGALTTFLFGQKGYVHLIQGIAVNHYIEESSHRAISLPFSLQLDSFRITRYPNTEAPADYISYITADGEPFRISMNHIFSKRHFRFYQSSFNENGRESWLMVNHDPWGMGITYTGYLIMGYSMCWLLLTRKGRFRTLLNHPLLHKRGIFFIILLLGTCTQAQQKQPPVPNRRQADSLACEPIMYQNRATILHTLARDFVQKITGKETYKGLTPEQILGGWLFYPEAWKDEPMIHIGNKELLKVLHLTGPYVRLSDLYTENEYRLQGLWTPARIRSDKPSALNKAILETDEKVGLILMLRQGTLIRPLPADGNVPPLSRSKIWAELWYNRISFSKILSIMSLACGLLSVIHLFYRSLYAQTTAGIRDKRIHRCFSIALGITFLAQLASYLLRWYIANRVPLSNGYETMQFMAVCVLGVAYILRKKFPFIVPFGFLLAGFALLVSHIGQMNPQITPLVPVLASPWLSIHVSVLMMSYTLLAFIMLNGILSLCLIAKHKDTSDIWKEKTEVLTLLSRLMLYPAVFLLAVGIFTGAIWANVSWGRYWGWDPKEVWALITLLVYAAAFHLESLPYFRHPLFFHAFCVMAFGCVLITYFGVNFLLGGMHSYVNP